MALLPSGSVQTYHLPLTHKSAKPQSVSSATSRVQSVRKPQKAETTREHFPGYADKEIRRISFNNWPSNKEQTPERLAAAGFFHAGSGDRTKCYSCGGGLTNWLPGDDPFVEHARWFPTCSFIRLTKGASFVDYINVTNPRTEKLPQVSTTANNKTGGEGSKIGDTTQTSTSKIPYESAKVIVQVKSPKKVITEDEERKLLLAENDRLTTATLCRLCKSSPVSALYMPCEHLVTCIRCSKSKPTCAVCNTRWTKVIKVFV